MTSLKESPLGKPSTYLETYSPQLLFTLERQQGRNLAGIPTTPLPFQGGDLWNSYELSWLNSKGKPEVALAELYFPCTTPRLVESKSLKLYLNSFNQTCFTSAEEVRETLRKDLSTCCGGSIMVTLTSIHHLHPIYECPGICLDGLDIETSIYQVDPTLLKVGTLKVEETLHSHLLKSNCLATGQPDWGSLILRYAGAAIDHSSLLQYIVSYRQHSGFHEHCVERIFFDILTRCSPTRLTVYAQYTRRGGLDINPFRSNYETFPLNHRLNRQ